MVDHDQRLKEVNLNLPTKGQGQLPKVIESLDIIFPSSQVAYEGFKCASKILEDQEVLLGSTCRTDEIGRGIVIGGSTVESNKSNGVQTKNSRLQP